MDSVSRPLPHGFTHKKASNKCMRLQDLVLHIWRKPTVHTTEQQVKIRVPQCATLRLLALLKTELDITMKRSSWRKSLRLIHCRPFMASYHTEMHMVSYLSLIQQGHDKNMGGLGGVGFLWICLYRVYWGHGFIHSLSLIVISSKLCLSPFMW